MGPVQVTATVVAALVTVVAVGLFIRAVASIVRVVRVGQPVDPARFSERGRRTATMLRETLGHTRMLKWTGIGVAKPVAEPDPQRSRSWPRQGDVVEPRE